MHLAELPDAAFLDVLVLVGPFGPDGALAVLTDLDQCAPAAFRREAVRRDVHDALQDHVIVELALLEPFAADDAIVELGDTSTCRRRRRNRRAPPWWPGSSANNAADVAAQLLVDVIAVGALQALDGFRVLEQVDSCSSPASSASSAASARGLGRRLPGHRRRRPTARRRAHTTLDAPAISVRDIRFPLVARRRSGGARRLLRRAVPCRLVVVARNRRAPEYRSLPLRRTMPASGSSRTRSCRSSARRAPSTAA